MDNQTEQIASYPIKSNGPTRFQCIENTNLVLFTNITIQLSDFEKAISYSEVFSYRPEYMKFLSLVIHPERKSNFRKFFRDNLNPNQLIVLEVYHDDREQNILEKTVYSLTEQQLNKKSGQSLSKILQQTRKVILKFEDIRYQPNQFYSNSKYVILNYYLSAHKFLCYDHTDGFMTSSGSEGPEQLPYHILQHNITSSQKHAILTHPHNESLLFVYYYNSTLTNQVETDILQVFELPTFKSIFKLEIEDVPIKLGRQLFMREDGKYWASFNTKQLKIFSKGLELVKEYEFNLSSKTRSNFSLYQHFQWSNYEDKVYLFTNNKYDGFIQLDFTQSSSETEDGEDVEGREEGGEENLPSQPPLLSEPAQNLTTQEQQNEIGSEKNANETEQQVDSGAWQPDEKDIVTPDSHNHTASDTQSIDESEHQKDAQTQPPSQKQYETFISENGTEFYNFSGIEKPEQVNFFSSQQAIEEFENKQRQMNEKLSILNQNHDSKSVQLNQLNTKIGQIDITIKEKQERITELEVSIEKKQKELKRDDEAQHEKWEAMFGKLTAEKDDIVARESQLLEKEQKLTEREIQLKVREDSLEEKEHLLTERQANIKGDQDERQAGLDQLQVSLEKREEIMNKKSFELSEREETIMAEYKQRENIGLDNSTISEISEGDSQAQSQTANDESELTATSGQFTPEKIKQFYLSIIQSAKIT